MCAACTVCVLLFVGVLDHVTVCMYSMCVAVCGSD